MISNLRDIWRGANAGARTGFIFGVALIIAGAIWIGSSALRTEYGVLFSGLESQDAVSIVAELERLKVPYRLGHDESTVEVRKDQVHTTRLKLMGKGMALRGGVGFEIFNDTDFGMTEFAQKINYQRALQGELARTITAFDEIKSARVHLVMPESGLFKKANQKPKASITLALKQGRDMQPEQVVGIQRLVAASVPEMSEEAVTVLDQRGVALSRAAESDTEDGAASTRFAVKNDIETYLARKVVAVLDRTFGPGKAMVSVDVTVNHDQVKVTQEDVLPSGGRGSEGMVVRRCVSVQGMPKPLAQASDWQPQEPAGNGSSTQEVEYQSGRRVEQIVSKPGSIRRISVGVMLPHALAPEQLDEMRQVLAMTVGLNSGRGDEIAISSVDRFSRAKAGQTPIIKDALVTLEPTVVNDNIAPSQPFVWSTQAAIGASALMLVVVVSALTALHSMRKRREMHRERLAGRERLLGNVRQWLRGEPAVIAAERRL